MINESELPAKQEIQEPALFGDFKMKMILVVSVGIVAGFLLGGLSVFFLMDKDSSNRVTKVVETPNETDAEAFQISNSNPDSNVEVNPSENWDDIDRYIKGTLLDGNLEANRRDTMRMKHLYLLGRALKAYYEDYGQFPEPLQKMYQSNDRYTSSIGSTLSIDLAPYLVPDYLTELPVDPVLGIPEAIEYRVSFGEDDLLMLSGTSEVENMALIYSVDMKPLPRPYGRGFGFSDTK